MPYTVGLYIHLVTSALAGLALAPCHIANCENKAHVVKEMSHIFAHVGENVFLVITIWQEYILPIAC